MTGEPLTVLVADDHPLYRDGLVGLIETTGMVVVGQASDGAEAVRLAAEFNPDVVVLDVSMPVLDGIEATRRIVAANPQARVLILTMLEDETVIEAVRAGARGYVVKSSSPSSTLAAIASVAAGDVTFSAALAPRLSELFAAGTRPRSPFNSLTPREHEVLELLARGWDNPRIATRLGIADKTVRNLVAAILVKLQVSDRVAAVEAARRAGLG
ncbi:MAG: response regulator transcription factor [Micropruina sp.]|uniref:response regulator n=1 Tax=Micropruina sp. TaxID=2737536 RepID=UPI0039E4D145